MKLSKIAPFTGGFLALASIGLFVVGVLKEDTNLLVLGLIPLVILILQHFMTFLISHKKLSRRLEITHENQKAIKFLLERRYELLRTRLDVLSETTSGSGESAERIEGGSPIRSVPNQLQHLELRLEKFERRISGYLEEELFAASRREYDLLTTLEHLNRE